MTATGSGASAWRRRTLGALVLGLAMAASGCRFGRAPGDGLGEHPLVANDHDAGAASEVISGENEQAAQPSAAAPGPSVSTGAGSAGARAPTMSPVSSGASGSTSTVSAGQGGMASGRPGAADSCSTRDQIEVCDPISNTGCLAELGMQCDVDLLGATPTGACVFSAPPPDPNSCLAIFPTQSCPPRTTCVEGACLKICLCDSDCDAAERCSMQLGASGFKACQVR